MNTLRVYLFFSVLAFSPFSWGDDMRAASLTITAANDNTFSVLWKVPVTSKKRKNVNILFDEHTSIASPKQKHMIANSFTESWVIQRPKGLSGLNIKIDGLQYVSNDVLLRIVNKNNETITAILDAENNRFVVNEKFQFGNTITTYIVLGIEHILIGLDHLLFVACLVFISNSRKKLFLTITGFTFAHSVTLVLAATDKVNLPIAPVEAIIALSIVFVAAEIARQNKNSLTLKYPVVVSSCFGLLHGFGFASVLADIGLPEEEKISALLSFNAGVEIGQLLFVGAIFILYKLIATITGKLRVQSYYLAVSYIAGGVSSIWLIERLNAF